MGEIVMTGATVHAPQLLTRPPQEHQSQLDADIAAMRELGNLLDETKPDVLIMVGMDHLETFWLNAVPTSSMITGERAKAVFAGRRYEIPIHLPLARALLDGLVSKGFDLAYSQDAELGHAFAAPFEFIHGGRNIPVIPLLVNVYLPPLPSPLRCAEFGAAIAEIIKERPERVGIVASGGMSHYPGTWKYYYPEYDFDRWVIQEIEEGRTQGLLNLTPEQLDEVGNTELLTWFVMLGAVGFPVANC